jgi:hypothetical protein
MFESKALRKRDEVSERFMILQSEELLGLYKSLIVDKAVKFVRL